MVLFFFLYIFIVALKFILNPIIILSVTGFITAFCCINQGTRRITPIIFFIAVAVIFIMIEYLFNKYRINFLDSNISIEYVNFPNEITGRDFVLYFMTFIPSLAVLFLIIFTGVSFIKFQSTNPLFFSLITAGICILLYSFNNFIEVPSFSINGTRSPEEKLFDIHEVSKTGELNRLLQLIKNEADVNKKTNKNRTPLEISIESGNFEITKVLIKSGADVNFMGSNVFSKNPLMLAASKGDFNTVKVLLENGADPHRIDRNTHNVLYYSKEYPDIFKMFIKINVDYKFMDQYSESILTIAAGMEKNFTPHPEAYNIVKYLLELGMNHQGLPGEHRTPLLAAVNASNIRVAKLLIKEGADTNIYDIYDTTPLIGAITKNNPGIVKLLLENGADPKLKGKTLQMNEKISPMEIVQRSLKRYNDDESKIKYQTIAKLLTQHGASQ